MKKILIILVFASTFASANNAFYGSFFDHSIHNNPQHLNNLNRYFSKQAAKQTWQYFDKENNAYVLEIKINNPNKNTLSIDAKNGFLVVKGKRQTQQNKDNFSSYTSSSFSHSFSLPADANINNMRTDFQHNSIKISLPKTIL